jgi:DedD protein
MEIDENLRNRVVGVSVITILTMIFLPMLLNESKDDSQETSELSIPDKIADTPSLTATLLPNNVDDVMEGFAAPAVKTDKSQTPPSVPKQILTATKDQAQLPPALEIATEEILETKRWFIQVASFNREENAFSLRDKLRSQGFSATVNSALSKNRTVYRLRVGPELSKQRAKEIKIKLNQLNNVKSIIILEH